MTDPRVERLAAVIVEYSLGIRAGDIVIVQGPTLAEPLLAELVRGVLRAGGLPYLRARVDGTDAAFLAEASDDQLSHLPPSAIEEIEVADVRIVVDAAWNTRELSSVDPARSARRSEATGPLLERVMQRSAAGDLRWMVTAFPCQAFAQDADMSLAAYEKFVFGAGWLGLSDPVAAWRGFGEKLTAVAARLADVRELRVLAEDTDLTVGVGGRTWIADKGDHNFPAGEVFTGPVETATRGDVRFSFPAIRGGRQVDDVRLRFEDGRVVRSEAADGGEYLRSMLGMDAGASVLGEFAIGANYAVQQFTKHILFDEKIGGTCHMAVGAGYPETGSGNASALHWDMVCDLRRGGEILADGETIYRDGRFLPSFAPDLTPPSA